MFFTRKRGKKIKPRQQVVVFFGVVFLLVGSFGVTIFHYVQAFNTVTPEPVVMELDPNIGIRPYVEEFLADNEAIALLPIIRCESQFKHFENDGTVLKNREGSSAIGVAQILSSKHPDPKIIKRYNVRNKTKLTVEDFDLTTLQGNLGYALVLYKIRGTRDWECARKI